MNELKPCPFCVGRIEVGHYSYFDGAFPYHCLDCKAYFRLRVDHDEMMKCMSLEEFKKAGVDLFNKFSYGTPAYPPEVKHAVERITPKKPVRNGLFINGGKCPICDEYVFEDENFCSECGQKIDWSEE